jgi:hypothetical protein
VSGPAPASTPALDVEVETMGMRPRDDAPSRYDVVRRIGGGGMGVVHEAFDRERGHPVALKTLAHFSPTALYAFKREFRALAGVGHPNLVHLYDLVATGNEPYFTMELVDGLDIVTYTRARNRAADGEDAATCPADIPRLRAALTQLAQGVHALHNAGKLHRDIKPSNVLVAADGRVVLLDFGLAADIAAAIDRSPEDEVVGTAHYMAPEQAAGDPPAPASDWYSVGVILYESLVGALPFVGSPLEVLAQKNTLDPQPPSARVSGVPPELDALCVELLKCDADLRPEGADILGRLASGPSEAPVVSSLPSAGPSIFPLVGRETHIDSLQAALDLTAAGQAVTVRVQGGSGMGKSALVQRFLDAVVGEGKAVALRGRAYEREAVPYKAFDAVIDALSRYLLQVTQPSPSEPAPRIAMPADVWALARLFPVLRRVPAVSDVADPAITDLQQVRRRAFSALRELLATLAHLRPLILYVDDVQWGDADSAALLLDLVREPDAPPILVVLACRDEDASDSPFLRDVQARWPERAELRDLWVGPLTSDDSMRLARSLVGTGEASVESLSTIAAEAAGSAFLIEELARGMSSRRLRADAGAVTLERMIANRLGRIADGPRRLLELVAVAGRPIPIAMAGEAAGIHEGLGPVVAMLRARRFVRTGLRDGREVVEASHDRIRETIVGGLDVKTARAHHASLARVLEATPGADTEALVEHLVGAGQPDRAGKYAEQAAEQATAKLAFDQAVRFYARAIDMTANEADRRRLRVRLAESLETAGHGAEAADAYLLAAKDAPAIRRAELQRAAAEQLLMSGHMERGARVLQGVLALWGMSVPRSPLAAVLGLLFHRLRLRFMGLRFEERAPDAVPREVRARIDAVYAVAIGLSIVDVVVSACMQARHLVLALRLGDTFQVMRAASLEASHLSSRGGPETPRERELFEIVQRLAEQGEDGEARQAFFQAKSGIRFFLRGRWKEAREVLDAAYARYPNNRGGSHSNAYLFSLYSLVFLGDFVELAQRQAHLLADAEQRGDIYTAVNLRVGYPNLAWLAADDVNAARRHAALAREAMSTWRGSSSSAFLVQHWELMVAEAQIELYAGEPARAYERLVRDERALKKSFLHQVQFLRAGTAYLRARCAVALAVSASSAPAVSLRSRVRLLDEAAALGHRLEREAMAWTAPLASLVAAAVANARGDRAMAATHLRAAIDRAIAADMALFAVAGDFALGRLMGEGMGDGEGQRLEGEARAWMTNQAIEDPERMVSLLVPGLWRG